MATPPQGIGLSEILWKCRNACQATATRLLIWFEGPVTRLTIARHGSAASRMRLLAAILFSELAPKGAPLIRRHIAPLLPQFLSTSRRKRTKPLAGVTNGLALFRRQLTKPVEPFTQTRLFVRLHLLPLLEPLAGL